MIENGLATRPVFAAPIVPSGGEASHPVTQFWTEAEKHSQQAIAAKLTKAGFQIQLYEKRDEFELSNILASSLKFSGSYYNQDDINVFAKLIGIPQHGDTVKSVIDILGSQEATDTENSDPAVLRSFLSAKEIGDKWSTEHVAEAFVKLGDDPWQFIPIMQWTAWYQHAIERGTNMYKPWEKYGLSLQLPEELVESALVSSIVSEHLKTLDSRDRDPRVMQEVFTHVREENPELAARVIQRVVNEAQFDKPNAFMKAFGSDLVESWANHRFSHRLTVFDQWAQHYEAVSGHAITVQDGVAHDSVTQQPVATPYRLIRGLWGQHHFVTYRNLRLLKDQLIAYKKTDSQPNTIEFIQQKISEIQSLMTQIRAESTADPNRKRFLRAIALHNLTENSDQREYLIRIAQENLPSRAYKVMLTGNHSKQLALAVRSLSMMFRDQNPFTQEALTYIKQGPNRDF